MKSLRASTSRLVALAATTVAARGSPRSSDSSPKYAPGLGQTHLVTGPLGAAMSEMLPFALEHVAEQMQLANILALLITLQPCWV